MKAYPPSRSQHYSEEIPCSAVQHARRHSCSSLLATWKEMSKLPCLDEKNLLILEVHSVTRVSDPSH